MIKFLSKLFKSAKINTSITKEGLLNVSLRKCKFVQDWTILAKDVMTESAQGRYLYVDQIGDKIVTIIDMKAGATYEAHQHNDADEHVQVIMGKIMDSISNVIIGAGDSYKIPAGKQHRFHIIEDTIYQTTFTLNEK